MMLADPVWTPDGRNILLRHSSRSSAGRRWQIGSIAYSTGAFRTITNDTNNYSGLRTGVGSRMIVTVQTRVRQIIDIMPGTGGPESAARELVSAREPLSGISWNPEGEILYARGSRILAMRPDGRERTVFAASADTPLANPVACAGGREIAFLWLFRKNGGTEQLWRMSADGSSPRPLADAGRVFLPACSPDGRWIAYLDPPTLKRVPTDGGTPQTLGGFIAQGGIGYSADGRTLAFISLFDDPNAPGGATRKLILLTPGSPPRTVDTNQDYSGSSVQFTQDGTAVAYAITEKAVDQISLQPLDGSAQRTITAFTSGNIRYFAWSPDGRSLALTRGYRDSDVVLLSDTATEHTGDTEQTRNR